MTILFETPFEMGDIICHKTDLNREERFIVLAYYILALNTNGETVMYNVDASNGDGLMKSFRPYEIDLVERLKVN